MNVFIIILIVLIALQSCLCYFERKGLYDRLMSRDIKDYRNKSILNDRKTPVTAHKRTLKNWRDTGGSSMQ